MAGRNSNRKNGLVRNPRSSRPQSSQSTERSKWCKAQQVVVCLVSFPPSLPSVTREVKKSRWRCFRVYHSRFCGSRLFSRRLVLAAYSERTPLCRRKRASLEKSCKTLLDQLADTRAHLDQARGESATQTATIARLGGTPCRNRALGWSENAGKPAGNLQIAGQ